MRIKDARMEQLEPHRRPHYPPTARLAILELRAARGWTLAQTASIFLVSPLTIASWMGRLEEEGPDALVRLPEPVNRFPDFVSYLVKRLKILCPALGKVKTAQILARAGLHLGPTTVRRMQRKTRWPEPRNASQTAPRVVSARKPNHLSHIDLTTVPTALGFWVSWLPFTLPQVWPFCRWLSRLWSTTFPGGSWDSWSIVVSLPLVQFGSSWRESSGGLASGWNTSSPTKALSLPRKSSDAGAGATGFGIDSERWESMEAWQ